VTRPRSAREGAIDAIELAPLPLVIVAEAAWISVLSGLLEEFALRQPEIGLPTFAICVTLGTLAARVIGVRAGTRWPAVALLLIAVAAIAGVLASSAARAALADGVGPAVAAHPGGLLAGLAMLRGYAYAQLPIAEGTVSRLLALGAPGLAAASLIGGLIGEPFRTRFLADAFGAAIVFVGSTVLALAFARLAVLGADHGLDWRRNPSWLAMTLVLLVVVVAAALPLAAIAGTAISILVGVALGPLIVAGMAAAFDRTVRRVLLLLGVAAVVVFILVALFGRSNVPPGPTIPGFGGPAEPSPVEQLLTVSIGGLIVVLAVAGMLVLVALWMRRVRPGSDDLIEEIRIVDRSGVEGPRRRRGRPGRRHAPADAVEAYVALVEELDRHPLVRRSPGETPAEHAARLRTAGVGGGGGLRLDLLAADYALVRDGGLALTRAEDRRAIERWQRLRGGLPRWAKARTREGAATPSKE
jgi:uncharacterized protein DUF4129